jgi:catechol 2,3-dioxygenase-like lactoylglutathione lyase family enzyme
MTSQHTPQPTQQSGPQGSYVVVRVPDIESSAEFYKLLGLELTREKHGDGPIHFSFKLSASVVCELYPLKKDAPSAPPGVRLGFQVDDLPALRERLVSHGLSVSAGASEASFVVLDPSGNQVEISARFS